MDNSHCSWILLTNSNEKEKVSPYLASVVHSVVIVVVIVVIFGWDDFDSERIPLILDVDRGGDKHK